MSVFSFCAPGNESFIYLLSWRSSVGGWLARLWQQLLISDVCVVMMGCYTSNPTAVWPWVLPHFHCLQHTTAGMWKHNARYLFPSRWLKPLQYVAAGGWAEYSHGVWVWSCSHSGVKTHSFALCRISRESKSSSLKKRTKPVSFHMFLDQVKELIIHSFILFILLIHIIKHTLCF